MGRGRGRHTRGARRGAARQRRQPGLLGTVRAFEGRSEVETAEGTFRISSRGLAGAMPGDRVYVSLRASRGGRRAVVEQVVERAVAALVGTFEPPGPLGAVRPLDSRIRQDFFVLPEDGSPDRLGVQAGDIVSARIVSYPTCLESGVVTLERRIGDAAAPSLGVECVMARFGLVDGHPQQAVDEAAACTVDVSAALADPLRHDARDRIAVTIDPVDARDFDDALSLERTPEGGWLLGVHIADVSAYVPWDSTLDLEARRRSTSVYLADRVLPMLPEHLSCDVCSLRPGQDRLAMTVDMRFDALGRIEAYEAYPSVIRSRVRTDYAAVEVLLAEPEAAPGDAALLLADSEAAAGEAGSYPARSMEDASKPTSADGADAGATPPAGGADTGAQMPAAGDTAAPADSAPHPAAGRARAACEAAAAQGFDLVRLLRDAHELACARRELRRRRGAIDFATTEVHALLDERGVPQRLEARVSTAATQLVEEAMLAANECVAEFLSDRDISACYRVHETPAPDALASAAATLVEAGALESDLAPGIMVGEPHAITRALERAAGTPMETLVNAMLLRAQQRAVYKPDNEGHYALGARAYCHFTSPIRRYPDLVVHRVLKLALARRELGRKAAQARARELVGTGSQALDAICPSVCRQASEAERVADAAARASQKVKVAQYYADRVGQRVRGTVVWVSDLGAFVQLDDTGAEGLIRPSHLGDQWWELDERRLRFVGANDGTVIGVGQRLAVEVASVDVLRGRLDLTAVQAGAALH